MPVIDVKNLKKTYKTHKREPGLASAFKSLFKREYEIKHALAGVNLEVEKGEIIGLIGPNGAGKSTIIKVLAGVLYPDEGYVNVLGFTPWKNRVNYVKHIGVVFGQKQQLWWDLPAVDTFHLYKEIYNIPERQFNRRLKYMVKLLDLENIIKTPVRDLSLGEHMKCKLVASLLHNPKLVFLDEPSIGLDIIAKDKMRNFIKKVNEEQKATFIITTHDMQDIERLCKRIVIINHGGVVYDGELARVRDLFLKSKFVDVKFESPFKMFKLDGCNVIDKKKYEIRLEVDLSKNSIKEVINYLISNFEIADILISDPPIEEIIQRIYKSKKW